jgi:hypothetical protein
MPSQCSAIGFKMESLGRVTVPTAAQDALDGHDTAFNSPTDIVRWIVHENPFQRSTSDPTAVHALLDEHETPLRTPEGIAVRWIDHLTPFQRSAKPSPTAVQDELDTHDTPFM